MPLRQIRSYQQLKTAKRRIHRGLVDVEDEEVEDEEVEDEEVEDEDEEVEDEDEEGIHVVVVEDEEDGGSLLVHGITAEDEDVDSQVRRGFKV